MSKSIFDIEIRLDINKEFHKMVKYLHQLRNTTETSEILSTFIGAINSYAFKKWPYRDTTLNCEEYLENVGIPSYYFDGKYDINEEQFLYYLEFIFNIYHFSSNISHIGIRDENVHAILENMNIIAEKMNYKFINDGTKFLLVKRNDDVDSVVLIVDEDISKLLLEYNDFKVSNDVNRKSEILKAIDKYIEKNKSDYSKVDEDTYKSIGYIMNNFGINHKMNDKYINISKSELLIWYDKCFMLTIHLIRCLNVKKINDERKALEK